MNHPQIPPDLDQLMWLLAEGDDEAARDEFSKRFPDFSVELMRRRATVRSLKGAKPHHKFTAAPTFQPRTVVESPRRSLWMWAPLAAILLMGFAFGSYMLTNRIVHEPTAQKPSETRPGEGVPFAANGDPDALRFKKPTDGTSGPLGPDDVQPVQNEIPLYMKPHSVKVESAPLHDVLDQVGKACDLDIEIAPKTPDPVISVEFVEVTGQQMLEQLGRAYGFTPLNQGQNRWLLIPSIPWIGQETPDSKSSDVEEGSNLPPR